MARAHARQNTNAIHVPARFVLAGVLGSLLLLGALNATAGPSSSSAPGQQLERSSFVVQHEAAISTSAASPARSHRMALLGAFLVFACLASIGARRLVARPRRDTRRRVEQFHVRLRGPPVVHVAF